MAQTFIPELAVLEKRIAKVNKIPDQFNRMMTKRNNMSDCGVMSILKVSDEKFFMKQNGQLMNSPRGNELSSSQLVTTFKPSPDPHMKSKKSISDVSFNAFASSVVKGQKKKVNFDLP